MERGVTPTRPWRVALVGAACLAVVAGCAQPRVAEVYPQVAEYEGREIEELVFENTDPFSADSLAALTETEETGCSLLFLPFCFPGTDWGRNVGRVNVRTLGEDLGRLEALYRRHGYFGTRVIPEFEDIEVGEADAAVRLRLVVQRGDGIVMDSVVVEGTEGIADPDSLEAILPLQPGDLMDLAAFAASGDVVRNALQVRGHAYTEVLRNYAVDTIQDRATVWLVAVPGPRVTVDTVLVDGIAELRRRDVTRQLTFDQGDLLLLSELRESQRNLYNLELVQFATVTVAEDTLQRAPEDSTTATVRISVSEGAEHVVETGASFGTVECVGVRGRWTDRSVFGGGRQLTIRGSVSRLGLGDPVAGLEDSACSQGEDSRIATDLDYRLTADFNQPYFLSPRNQINATLFTERQSEPGLFQRTARGLRLTGTRRFQPREYLTAAADLEYRRMEATPILYCFAFRACGAEEVAPFTGGRWRNALMADWVADRGNRAISPTAGYVLRSAATWSGPLMYSDYDFLRANAEWAGYWSVGRGWVLAGSVELGSFITSASLGPIDFVPPEERFYAGGASSVRGYGRFDLGPGLYLVDNDGLDPDVLDPDALPDSLAVEFFPTGGISMGVLSAEARFPSPVLSDYLRLAAFVDAGTIGLDPIWERSPQWRVTPGAGLRIQTPVGPIRADVGYNPYRRTRGPLYATDPETGDLQRISDSFRTAGGAGRFTLHIAVGQAF